MLLLLVSLAAGRGAGRLGRRGSGLAARGALPRRAGLGGGRDARGRGGAGSVAGCRVARSWAGREVGGAAGSGAARGAGSRRTGIGLGIFGPDWLSGPGLSSFLDNLPRVL